MLRVHRYLTLNEVRAEARRLSVAGLHAGIDLKVSESLFEPAWDRDARDVGRMLRSFGLKVVVRGPGSDYPSGALDAHVVDQVRVCHQRALAAAMHYGSEVYVMKMASTFGLSRTERMRRIDAASVLVSLLSREARPRGIRVVVEQDLETDADAIEVLAKTLRREGAGLLLSPARSICLNRDPVQVIERCPDVLVGADLTDRHGGDLEIRPPGSGVLSNHPVVGRLAGLPNLEFYTVELPAGASTRDFGETIGALPSGLGGGCPAEREPCSPAAL